MQPIFPGHSVFFDGNVNAKGLKPIHRKLGHRCGKWFIDPRTFEGLRGSGTATNDTAFAHRRDSATGSRRRPQWGQGQAFPLAVGKVGNGSNFAAAAGPNISPLFAVHQTF